MLLDFVVCKALSLAIFARCGCGMNTGYLIGSSAYKRSVEGGGGGGESLGLKEKIKCL